MKKIVIAASALALAGCASSQPGIDVRTVEVPVVRVEKCIAAEDVPETPPWLGRRKSRDARVLADILLARVFEWQVYGKKVEAVMKGCTG